MKYLLSLMCIAFCCFELDAQELHNDNNAANFLNESNSTNGWTGGANISSVSDNPIDGSFCIRIESTPSNQRDARYSFAAIIGEEYNISIWARTGNQSYKPAFANWQGVSGFSTRPIGGSNWAEYTFTVTATSSNPEIRIYVSPASGGSPGNHIFIDRVSISSSAAADNQPPNGISDLNATNIQETSLSLNWTEPFDNVGVVNYEVFEGNNSLGFTNGPTSFNINNLDPSSSYVFTVIAIDAAGNRSSSNNSINIATLDDDEPPSAITTLSAENVAPNSVILNWEGSTDNVAVVDYEVFQNGQSIGIISSTRIVIDGGIEPNTTYNFSVFARDAVPNTSAASNNLQVTTPAELDIENPEVPTDLQITNNFESAFLTWTEANDNVGVINYEIFQDAQSIGFSNGSLTFSALNLIPCTTYVFGVQAIDEAGNNSASAVGEITIEYVLPGGDVPPLPSEIESLNAVDLGNKSVTLNWVYEAELGDRVLDFEVLENGNSIGFTSAETFININDLIPETAYTFTIRAILCSGRLEEKSINITTLITPPIVNYDAENANLETVDWLARDLFASRNLGVGTTNTQGYRLAVAGNVVAEEIKVSLQTNWPDFVFEEKFELTPLDQVENYIDSHGHLSNIPSAAEVEKNGINLGEMNAKLLEKIEELTLYLIIQEKKIKQLEEKMKGLEK